MAGRVITITSGKGGVGKTTSTANLGVALARWRQRVVCVDADIGLRNLDLMLGLDNSIVHDLFDVIQGLSDLNDALVQDKQLNGLYLLSTTQGRDLSGIAEWEMARLCEDMRRGFDFVLIDSPAGIEQGFKNALAPADEVLIITTPEISAVRDADRVAGLVETAGKPAPKLIINRLKTLVPPQPGMLDASDVLDLLGIELIGIVPEDQALIVSTNKGQPVALDDRSPSGTAYLRIAQRLLGQQVDFQISDNHPNLMGRLSKIFQGFKAAPPTTGS